MNYLHITYIYPQGTPSENPEGFDPDVDRVEQYEAKFSNTVPQIGDSVHFDDADWQVVAIHPYEAIAASDIQVYEIWYSQDGSDYRRDWQQESPPHIGVDVRMNVEMIDGDWVPWDIYETLDDLPKPGTPHEYSSEWALQTIQTFRPVGDRPVAGFGGIHICFFAQTSAPSVKVKF